PLERPRVRQGDLRRPRDDRSGRDAGRIRHGGGDHPRPGAGDPALVRQRVEAVPNGAAGRPGERPRDHADGGTGVAGPMTTGLGRRIVATSFALSLAAASLLVVVAPAVAADP